MIVDKVSIGLKYKTIKDEMKTWYGNINPLFKTVFVSKFQCAFEISKPVLKVLAKLMCSSEITKHGFINVLPFGLHLTHFLRVFLLL